jgi:hypothetical protein
VSNETTDVHLVSAWDFDVPKARGGLTRTRPGLKLMMIWTLIDDPRDRR